MSIRQLEWISFTSHTGYGTAAKDMIFALHRNGWNVRLTPLDLPIASLSNKSDREILSSLSRKQKESGRIHVFCCIPDSQRRVVKEGNSIGFATFETVGPPANWVQTLNRNDAVICPSEFCRQVFVDAGVTRPVFVVPHVLNLDHFRPLVRPKGVIFRFLFFGNWKKRKGYEELLHAYYTEFAPDEPVCLHMKAEQKRDVTTAIKRVIGDRKHPPILAECEAVKDNDLPAYLRSFDCLVAPTRGEGFGLPILQSMACGVPVIATACTGVVDFLSEQTGWTIPVKDYEVVPCMDGIPQFRNRLWPRIDPIILGKRMRAVLNNPEDAEKKSKEAVKMVKDRFGYNIVSDHFNTILERIGV